MSAMNEMGIKRKDLYPRSTETKPEKDYDNEKCHPCLDVTGKHATLLGAEDLEAGQLIKQTVIWRVKSVRKTETNGKKEHSLTLDMVKASDPEPVDGEQDEGDDEAGDTPISPGLASILGARSDG